MKSISEKAIELIGKFAAGAPCKVDLKDLENRMFWPFLLKNSEDKDTIDEGDVKKYIFKQHAEIVFKRWKLDQLNAEEAVNCMAKAENRNGKLVCTHDGKEVCEINQQEADLIEQSTKDFIEEIRKGL